MSALSVRRAICYIETRTFARDEGSGVFLPEDTFGASLPCRVRADGGGITVSYTEKGDAEIDTRIAIENGTVTLTRRGGVNFSARLEKGTPCDAPYSVGAYAFDTVCTLEDLRVGEAPLSVLIAYRMDTEGAHRRIELSVREETPS